MAESPKTKRKINKKRQRQLAQRFSKQLDTTLDKVSLSAQGTLDIAVGTSIQKVESLLGLDKAGNPSVLVDGINLILQTSGTRNKPSKSENAKPC